MQKLKEDILKLLKEDETFRYAILGLLGYDIILKRFEEHDKKFNSIFEELGIITKKLEEHDKKFNAILEELRDLRRISDEHTKILEQHTRILEEHTKRLEEHDKKFNAILEELNIHRAKLEEHDKKFNAILEELNIHRAKLEEHDKKFNEIVLELRSLRRISDELRISIGSLGGRVGKDMEKMVLNIYKDQLMQIGINPDNAKRFRYIDREGKYGIKNQEYEFDIIISDAQVDVIEVKAHTAKDDVEWFNEKAERVKDEIGKPIRRKIIVTVHVDEDALDKAKKLGLLVIYGNVIPQ